MKRKGEIVLSIIGGASSLIMIVIGLVFLYRKDDEAYLNYLHANWSESQVATSLEQMNQAGTMWVLPGIIGIALSIIAIILLKGNGGPKLTGWILILSSVVVCIISVFGFIPAMFFGIAGVMVLVRNLNIGKSKQLGK
ncbi:DUF4064 domain-containing protein [Aneurinibacillus aneurinilyticus]|jgi:membrane-anchored glycerophosphoryl diester phosphodiesterase (GDPDase)|uniref:DUF4064 domain-containing protein n=1 Tax=Aneurinibacillus aneurinilyticus TaxID=1391 RepID=UPI0023F7DB6E|nr:DUF4064 domain-containing protein [Aneurinibacillus aneurinilyticus]MCI1696044.1 DUF4064 domain-containing protein [Aneurinibacillus aneurinilyticus]